VKWRSPGQSRLTCEVEIATLPTVARNDGTFNKPAREGEVIKKADFTYFLVDESDVNGNSVKFSADESRHILKVCRLQNGDVILATDGAGKLLKVTIESTSKSRVTGKVVASQIEERPRKSCHLAIPIAASQKMDWVIEKCTEIGIDKFHFFACERAMGKPPGSKRIERARRIAAAAIKQSMRTYVPAFESHDGILSLSESFGLYDLVVYGHFDITIGPLSKVVSSRDFERILVLVGPESGFSDSELQILQRAGAVPSRYGDHRLRMETAAVVLPALIIDSLLAQK
jgi:16S rRNA (uracil1498-N3)-methyltransferase